ncbi:hypothetical protein PIB30_045480 [Stylosanthes scabra]|uniref:Uncharacterized protein n=1 Tax=Stylosanthes scabra TaxID=79078 RepID=A0ABU6WI49_9FABA|nr:hypothetical protein [Stylosanthes scabra]
MGHHPLLVNLEGNEVSSVNRPYRFEKFCLKHPDFDSLIRQNWQAGDNFFTNSENLKRSIDIWNKDEHETRKFGDRSASSGTGDLGAGGESLVLEIQGCVDC